MFSNACTLYTAFFFFSFFFSNSRRPLFYIARSMSYLGCVIPQGDYMLKLPQKHRRTFFLFLLFKIKINFSFFFFILKQWGGTVIIECGRRQEGPQLYLIESAVLELCVGERSKKRCHFVKKAFCHIKLPL